MLFQLFPNNICGMVISGGVSGRASGSRVLDLWGHLGVALYAVERQSEYRAVAVTCLISGVILGLCGRVELGQRLMCA